MLNAVLFIVVFFLIFSSRRFCHLHIFVEISPRKRKRCSNGKRKSYVPSIRKIIRSTSISPAVRSPKFWQPPPPPQQQHHHHRRLLRNRYVRPQVKKPPNWKSTTTVCRIHRPLQPIRITNCILMNRYHQFRTKVITIDIYLFHAHTHFVAHSYRME